jgi:hypothetical protein
MRLFPKIRMWRGILALAVLTAIPCFATEVAVLKNGFSIRHERREVVGGVTRLYVNSEGSSYVDVSTTDIEHFEKVFDLPASLGTSGLHTAPAGEAAVFGSDREPVGPQPEVDLNQVVNAASARYRLDPDFVSSVIRAESGFNVRAVSPKGARGLMQLMPGTASQLGVRNAFDAQANIEGGTRYLRELLERYHFDLVKALAAYNAGPQRVEKFGGVPPYYETRVYVARVVRDFNKKKVAQAKSAKPPQRVSEPSAKPSASGVQRSRSIAQANAGGPKPTNK